VEFSEEVGLESSEEVAGDVQADVLERWSETFSLQ
jgi:hypothetical protein